MVDSQWRVSQILLDLLLLLSVGVPTPLIKNSKAIFWRGFFCNDSSIRNPIVEPSSFIESHLFHPIGWLFSFTLIVVIEFTNSKEDEKKLLGSYKLPFWLYEAYCVLLSFSFGLLCTILITTIFKGALGRLRPTFLTDCLPNINCSLPLNKEIYHISYECTNQKFKQNSRLSFPSGHSSFAMYCALFLAFYIQKKLKPEVSKLVKSAIQIFLLFVAFYTGFSRVLDFKHFWSDVLGGFFIGGANAALISLNLYSELKTSNFEI